MQFVGKGSRLTSERRWRRRAVLDRAAHDPGEGVGVLTETRASDDRAIAAKPTMYSMRFRSIDGSVWVS